MKSSLEKSHSKLSNSKLTLICFMLSLGVSIVWLGVLLLLGFQNIEKAISIATIVVGGVLSVFSVLLVSKFTR